MRLRQMLRMDWKRERSRPLVSKKVFLQLKTEEKKVRKVGAEDGWSANILMCLIVAVFLGKFNRMKYNQLVSF